jgi:hypothetical protein
MAKSAVRALRLALVISVLLVFLQTPQVAASPHRPDATITLTIDDACYLDLDGDSKENDVYVRLKFELDWSWYYEFYYYIELTLPSGESFAYLVWVWTVLDVLYLHNLFYNHATESGDYQVYVEALLVVPDIAFDIEEYVFDPPGGSEGDKPRFTVI